ncbi:MAG: VWA domain-containing protein, partial [Reinekea sp.]|nr:VWA domain-containing protein [Reinekea sp.]
VFGSFAEIQSPLTPDTLAIKELLADLRPGMAEGSTAIGDGLALAVKQLRESDSPDKVIILLSDGENNSGSVTPEQATQVAVQSGIKVYTIGFGSDGSNSIFGRLGFGGNGIDEATLKDIAEQTQGQYFRATSTSDLIDVFNLIEQLEPSEEFQDQQRVVTELYWLPLSMALLLLALQHFFPLYNRWVQTR